MPINRQQKLKDYPDYSLHAFPFDALKIDHACQLLIFIGAINSFFLWLCFRLEPRGGQEEFESVLNGYYSSINQRKKPVMGRKKKAKGSALNDSTPHEVSDENKKKGAAFLAVCRGKVPQG